MYTCFAIAGPLPFYIKEEQMLPLLQFVWRGNQGFGVTAGIRILLQTNGFAGDGAVCYEGGASREAETECENEVQWCMTPEHDLMMHITSYVQEEKRTQMMFTVTHFLLERRRMTYCCIRAGLVCRTTPGKPHFQSSHVQVLVILSLNSINFFI